MLQLVDDDEDDIIVINEVRKPTWETSNQSSCLICLNSEVCEINLDSEPSFDEEACLKKQLIPIFILRRLLHFPSQECGKLLKKYVRNPDNWCRICNDCAELVEEAFQLTQQIAALEKELEGVGTQVRSKLKESLSMEDLMGVINVEREDKAVNISSMIRNYFRGSKEISVKKETSVGIRDADSYSNYSGGYDDSCIEVGNDVERLSPISEVVGVGKSSKYNFRKVRDRRKYGRARSEIKEDEENSSKSVTGIINKSIEIPTSAKTVSRTVMEITSSEIVSKSHTPNRESRISIEIDETGSDPDFSFEDMASHTLEVDDSSPKTSSKAGKGRRKLNSSRNSHTLSKRFKSSHNSSKSPGKRDSKPKQIFATPYCERCKFHFKQRGSYKRHMATHKITDQFDEIDTSSMFRVRCKLCGHEDRRVDMYMHMRLNHSDVVGMGVVQCHLCDKQFSCTASLNVHIKSRHTEGTKEPNKSIVEKELTKKDEHTEDSQTETTSTGGAAADKAEKRAHHAHLNKVNKRGRKNLCPKGHVYTCTRDDCDFKSIYYASIQKHKENHKIKDVFDETNDKDTRKVKCKLCHEEGFRNKMFMHVRVQHGEVIGLDFVICHLCDKTFPRKNDLTEHIRGVHEKSRRHNCTLCEASFMSKQAFEDHYAKHLSNGENTIVCELCGMSFSTRQNMRCHKRHFHRNKQVWDPSSGERSRICRYCGVQAINQGMLRDHMKVAHPEKFQFKCDQCDAVYVESRGLNVHVKTKHSGNVKCQYCEMVLSSVEHLRLHVKAWCKKSQGASTSAIEIPDQVEVFPNPISPVPVINY